MIIHNLYVLRLAFLPSEADSVLVIYSNTMLTFSISVQRFKPIARRRKQIAQIVCVIQVDELPPSRSLNAPWQLERNDALEDLFGFGISKRLDHYSIVS